MWLWHWGAQNWTRLVGGGSVLSLVIALVVWLRKSYITKSLNRFHAEGTQLLATVRTHEPPMHIHDAQQRTADWINRVHDYLAKPWHVPSRAVTFLGDFETTRRHWAKRWYDRELRKIDETITMAKDLPDTARVYQQQAIDDVAKVLQERLERLHSIIVGASANP